MSDDLTFRKLLNQASLFVCLGPPKLGPLGSSAPKTSRPSKPTFQPSASSSPSPCTSLVSSDSSRVAWGLCCFLAQGSRAIYRSGCLCRWDPHLMPALRTSEWHLKLRGLGFVGGTGLVLGVFSCR